MYESKQEHEQNDYDDSSEYKQVKISGMKAIAEEYTCPLSLELLFDPVTAEDGHLYERSLIKQAIVSQGNNLRSPKTNLAMGPRLFTAVSARNNIQNLVESGAIDGKIAETYIIACTKKKAAEGDIGAMNNLGAWYKDGLKGLPEDEELSKEWLKQAKDAKYVFKIKKEAEEGCSDAMYKLGIWYQHQLGMYGFTEDYDLAFQWFKKSAGLRNVIGMATYGVLLIDGAGKEKNITHGTGLVSRAAEKGSDFACYILGKWYFKGFNRFQEDVIEAEYWLTKAVDGSCSNLNLNKQGIKKALKLLKELKE